MKVMTPTTLTPTLTRRAIGGVGVDAGVVAIGEYRDGDHMLLTADAAVRHGHAIASSGWGDGYYSVLEVSNDDRVVGVEVVFISAAANEAVDELCEVPRPDEATMRAAWSATDRDPAAVEAYRRWNDAWDAAAAVHWDRILCETVPEGTAETVDTLVVNEPVGIGDPCHGPASLHVELPAGLYDVIVWRDARSALGRVARLGLRSKVDAVGL